MTKQLPTRLYNERASYYFRIYITWKFSSTSKLHNHVSIVKAENLIKTITKRNRYYMMFLAATVKSRWQIPSSVSQKTPDV